MHIIKRIETIWSDCLDRYDGPFLFGDFTIADAMFAPVVSRIDTYAIPKSAAMEAYSGAIQALPAWQDGCSAGRAEAWICENVEV